MIAAGPPVCLPASRPDLLPAPAQAELGSGRRKHPSRLRRTSTPDHNEPGHVQRLLQIYDSIRDGACRPRLSSCVCVGHAAETATRQALCKGPQPLAIMKSVNAAF